MGWPQIQRAFPNPTHHSLVSLHRSGHIAHIITQNVDGLHQTAGSPTQHTTELHGTLHEVHCLTCSHAIPRDDFQATLARMNPDWARWAAELTHTGTRSRTNPDGDVELPASVSYANFAYPSCPSCGTGIIKPSVVFFGENIHQHVKLMSFQAIEQNSAVLVIGSSLTTYSAFRLVKMAKEMGKQVGIVNLGTTRGDEVADFKIDLGCGVVIPGVEALDRATGRDAGKRMENGVGLS